MLIWAQHAANKRTRLFSLFSAWVSDRVIHFLKAYKILNPLIVKSFFYVTHEEHRSLIKKNTHNLESNNYCVWQGTHETSINVAFQVMGIVLFQTAVCLIGYVEKWFDYQWIQNLISFKNMYDSITNSSRNIKKVVVKHKFAFHVNAQYCVFLSTWSNVIIKLWVLFFIKLLCAS